jgi:transcriptional regulator with XRE-family HTH domain
MLGAEIRKARKKAGMTQEQVAVAAQLDRTYISLLENDRVKLPTLTVLFRLCDALGIRASHIVSRLEKQRNQSATRGPGHKGSG